MSDVTFKDEDDIWQDEDATFSDHTENLILFTASSKGDSSTPSIALILLSDVFWQDEDVQWSDGDVVWSEHAGVTRFFSASVSGDSDTSDPSLRVLTGKYAHGEENPTADETPVSWANWSNGAGGSPNISGDADWGKLSLLSGDVAHSPVYDTGGTHNKKVVLTKNLYGSGDSYFDLYIRGQNTTFTQDAVSPSWEAYTGEVNKTWEFIQARVVVG